MACKDSTQKQGSVTPVAVHQSWGWPYPCDISRTRQRMGTPGCSCVASLHRALQLHVEQMWSLTSLKAYSLAIHHVKKKVFFSPPQVCRLLVLLDTHKLFYWKKQSAIISIHYLWILSYLAGLCKKHFHTSIILIASPWTLPHPFLSCQSWWQARAVRSTHDVDAPPITA